MKQTSVGISGLEVNTVWTSGPWAGVQNDQLQNQKRECWPASHHSGLITLKNVQSQAGQSVHL